MSLVTLVFFDSIAKKTGNYLANRAQDDFRVHIKTVDSNLFALKSDIQLSVFDRKTDKEIIQVNELTVDLNPFEVLIDIYISGLSVSLTKELVTRMSSNAEEPSAQKDSSTDYLEFIGQFTLRQFDLTYGDDLHTLLANLHTLDLNFTQGTGMVNGVSARLKDFKQNIFNVNRIDLKFNTEGILGEESAKLGVTVHQSKLVLVKEMMSALKGLTDFPDQKEDEKKVSPLTELSFIQLRDSNLETQDQKISSNLGLLAVDFENGKAEVHDLKSNWTHTKRNLISLDKASLEFDPSEVGLSEYPTISMIITGFDFYLGKELKSLSQGEKESEHRVSPDLPLTISRILVGSSNIHMLDYPGIGKQKHLTVRSIFGNVHDITMRPGTPLGHFNFNATFEGKSKLMANGKFDLAGSFSQFSVDYRVFDLDMTKLNPELRQKLPLTFREGEFDLLGEVIKREKDIVGYFKPFLIDSSYLGNEKEFKNTKHFFMEIGATITNWLFENSETETVAATVPFAIRDGELSFDVGEAIWSSIEHGLFENKRVKPSANRYRLKQAQEVEKK